MPLSMSIRAVFFDLDGTLRHSQPGGEAALAQYLNELGYPLTPAQQQEVHRWVHYYWAVAPELLDDIRELEAETPAFWLRYTERRLTVAGFTTDLPALASAVVDKYNAHYQPTDYVPPDVIPTLQTLRAQGYILGLVSNRVKPLDDYARTLGLRDHLHFTLAAGEVQSWKPDPAIFRHALTRANCAPEETVYVGDNFYADVEGARGAGLHPVLIDPDSVFPEADCPIITQLDALVPLLAGFK